MHAIVRIALCATICLALWGCGRHTRSHTPDASTPPILAPGPTTDQWVPDPEYMGIYIPADYAWAPAYFDFDVWSRFRSDDDMLTALYHAQALQQSGDHITITGHCDERGTQLYNLALGIRRAEYVRQILTSYGVDPKTITVRTMGEEQPADLGHSEAAWAKNRRAEFQAR